MKEVIRIGLDRPTGNFWIDNGLVVLYDLFGEGEFEAEELLNKIVEKLVVETGNTGEYYDEKENRVKEYRKRNWKYPANLFIKSTPSADKKKVDGKEYFLSPPEFNLSLNFSKATGVCDVCGAVDHLTDAKMWMFPFTVEPSKFSNFYSGLKRGTKLCPRCALSGLAAYLGWLWKAQGKDKLHIFIFYSDLDVMLGLRRDVFVPLATANEQKGGNIPVEFSGSYIHETTLGLLLRIFQELRSQKTELGSEGKKLLEEILGEGLEHKPLTLFAFSGTPGRAFNMDSMMEFSDFRTLYRLYNRWIDLLSGEEKPHKIVVNAFKQFYKREGNNINTIWRDKISWAVLELRDPSPFVESFLFEAKLKEAGSGPLSYKTLEIFELYWKEVISMDKDLLNVLKGFGHSLGTKVHEKNETGLLYELRNAKNPDDFFKVLNDIQFRLELTIPENILNIEKGEKIMGVSWLRIKTLLSIYAMNTYLMLNKSGNKEVNNG